MNAAAPRTAKRKRTRRAVVAGFIAAAALMAVAAPMVLGGDKTSAAAVPMTTVTTGTLVISASADGQVEAADTYDVYPDVSGTVEDVYVAVGDRVEAGDRLFTLDEASLESAVRQAKAQLAQADQQVALASQQIASARQQVGAAKLQLSQAEQNVRDLRSLTGTMAVGAARIEEAKQGVSVAKSGVESALAAQKAAAAAHASAKASRETAQVAYDEAKADLLNSTVVAPADGIVTGLNVSEGSGVTAVGSASSGSASSGSSAGMLDASASAVSSASSAPVVIADDSALLIRVAVNEYDIADMKAGQPATVTVGAANGLRVPATVRWVSPNSTKSGNVRTYEVELELAEHNERLRSGMTASADISTLTIPDALMVPKSSVRVDGTTKFVTLVKPDGSQEKRTVTTGRSDDTNVQILTGLEAGQKVATSSADPVEDRRGGLMPPRPPAGM